MRQRTITLPDDLEQAVERYRERFEVPPEFDTLVRRALVRYLAQPDPDITPDDNISDDDDIIYPTRPKPEPMENPPSLLGGASVAEAIIDERNSNESDYHHPQ